MIVMRFQRPTQDLPERPRSRCSDLDEIHSGSIRELGTKDRFAGCKPKGWLPEKVTFCENEVQTGLQWRTEYGQKDRDVNFDRKQLFRLSNRQPRVEAR